MPVCALSFYVEMDACVWSLIIKWLPVLCALRCVNLARSSSYFMLGDNNETAEAWDWLRENDTHSSTMSRDSRYLRQFQTLPFHRAVWVLLQDTVCAIKHGQNQTKLRDVQS